MVQASDYVPNETGAVVISNQRGRIVPDIFATDDDNDCKMGTAHPKLIHNPREKYGQDTPESDPW